MTIVARFEKHMDVFYQIFKNWIKPANLIKPYGPIINYINYYKFYISLFLTNFSF